MAASTPAGRPLRLASLDLRLAAGALAAWLSTLLALRLHVPAGVALGAVALTIALAALWARHPAGPALAVVFGGIGVATLATTARVHDVHASPVSALAAREASVVLECVVANDPKVLAARSATGGPRVVVAVRPVVVTFAGRSLRASGRVLVLAPADGWDRVLPSQRVRLTGRLAPSRSADLTVAVLTSRAAPTLLGRPSMSQRVSGNLRAGLRDAAGGLPPPVRGLLPGLAIGDTSALDPVLAEEFRTAGLTHLLAVSGANCTIMIGAVLLAFRTATAGPRTTAAAAGLALVAFVVLVRPSSSVLRAAVMSGVALLALAGGRRSVGPPALAVAVFVLLIVDPSTAATAGFTLSVLATAALLVVAPVWADRLRQRGVPAGVAEAVAVSAAAHLATAPVVVTLSGRVSLVAVPANLLAVPAVAPATVLGVLATVVHPVSAGGARALAWLAGIPTRWLVTVAGHAASLPLATVGWPGGAGGAVLLAGLTTVAVVVLRRRGPRRLVLVLALDCLLVAVAFQVAHRKDWPPDGWLFVACDVGQGDALVVRTGRAEAVVVDTGPEPTAADGCLRRLGVSSVPLLVLTHLHADHVGGLDGVLHGRRVGALGLGPLHEPGWAWHAVQDEARWRRLSLWQLRPGERREVHGVTLEVLGPMSAMHHTRSDPNNSSVVLRIGSSGHTLLLTGDAEIEEQVALRRAGVDPRADVLKVPHHGSAWSSPDFLGSVHARVAVISVGAGNRYGHPAPSLLATLLRLGVPAYRTDRDGDVAVCVLAGRLRVATRAGHPP